MSASGVGEDIKQFYTNSMKINPVHFPCKCFSCVCGLVVRVYGYRYRGLGFDSRRYQIFCVVVGLERVPLSLVKSIEYLLE